MFTGDNPLNATDPLGLQGSGGAQAIAAQNKAEAETAKYCQKHPNAKGHNCGGLWHEFVGTVTKGVVHLNNGIGDIPGATSLANHLPSPGCLLRGFVAFTAAAPKREAAGAAGSYALHKIGVDFIADEPIGWAAVAGFTALSCAVSGVPRP
jgi:hypothetical protein